MNPAAVGEHTTFRRHGETGVLEHYETWRPQTNPRDPKPWESVKRFDRVGDDKGHYNKVLKTDIPEPHVHDPNTPGGIRPAEPWEMTRGIEAR